MAEELKACPFCGFPVTYSELEIVPRTRKRGEQGIQAVCMDCRASGPWVPGIVDDEGSALAAWDRRAEPTPQLPEITNIDKVGSCDELPEWVMNAFRQLIDEIFEDVKSSPCCIHFWKTQKLKEILSRRGKE